MLCRASQGNTGEARLGQFKNSYAIYACLGEVSPDLSMLVHVRIF